MEQVSSAILHLLAAAAGVVLLVVLLTTWRRARRPQLILDGVVNATGDKALDGLLAGIAHLLRQQVDGEIAVVARRRDWLLPRLTGEPRDVAGAPPGPASPRPDRRRRRQVAAAQRVADRLDSGLTDLLTAARDVAPQQAAGVVKAVSALLSHPRGLAAAAVVQARGETTAPRLGLSVDIRRLDDGRSTDSTTFWEPAEGSPGSSAGQGERVVALLGPAARWAAVQLTVRAVFPQAPRGQERGLDRLLSGMLLAQSVPAFPSHGPHLRRLAVDHLLSASTSLGERGYHLAALADAFDRLAALPPTDPVLYEHAHREYARAVTVLRRPPSDPALVERYRIREAISWLDSGTAEACARGLSLVREHPEMVGDDSSVETTYDAACLFALAARRSPDEATRSEHRRTAARLLLQALTAPAGRRLREGALTDPQLADLEEWTHEVLPWIDTVTVEELVARLDRAGQESGPSGAGSAR